MKLVSSTGPRIIAFALVESNCVGFKIALFLAGLLCLHKFLKEYQSLLLSLCYYLSCLPVLLREGRILEF